MKKPTTRNDPCPGTTGTVRFPYPYTLPENQFYLRCDDGIIQGYWRERLINGEPMEEPYFKDCPADGNTYKVFNVYHSDSYFVCVNGIHIETKAITSDDVDVLTPEDLPKWNARQQCKC